MKRLFTFTALLVALHLSITSQSGWFWQNPLLKGGSFGAPQFVSSSTAYDKWREGPGVRLVVYDILGREIETLVNEQLQPGVYEVTWDGTNYPSGVYFYQLITKEYQQTKKMVLIK